MVVISVWLMFNDFALVFRVSFVGECYFVIDFECGDCFDAFSDAFCHSV